MIYLKFHLDLSDICNAQRTHEQTFAAYSPTQFMELKNTFNEKIFYKLHGNLFKMAD